MIYELEKRQKRIRQRSSLLSDSINGNTWRESNLKVEDMSEFETQSLLLKTKYFSVIDRISTEILCRFYDNSDILIAITEANNIDQDDFDLSCLAPLNEINLKLPSETELTIVKQFLAKKENTQGKLCILEKLFPVRETVKDTYQLFEAVETFGSSTATSECSFSALSRIDTVRRQSMTDERLCNLTFLAFEKKI